MPATRLTRPLTAALLAALLAACSTPVASPPPTPAPQAAAPTAASDSTAAPTAAPAPTADTTAGLDPTAAPTAAPDPTAAPSAGEGAPPPEQRLVYRRDDSLYAAGPSPELLQPLVPAAAEQGALPWAASPDGSALAYVRARGVGRLAGGEQPPSIALYVVGAGIPGERKLLELLPPGGVDLSPGEEASMGLLPALTSSQQLAWAPDGSAVVVASAHEGQVDLYAVALDGAATRLTDTPELETQPAWSGDGAFVAAATLTSFGTGAGWSDVGVVVARGDGGGAALARSPLEGPSGVLALSHLIWADDRTLLLALPGFFGPGQVRALDVAGGAEAVIFEGDLTGAAWSAAAGALAIGAAAYSEQPAAAPGLYLWRPGDATARLVAEGDVGQAPVWSPTGEWVAFLAASADGLGDVWLAPAIPEREPYLLARGPAPAIVWSPDGKLLAAGGALWHRNGSPVDPLPGADPVPLAWGDDGLFFASRDEASDEQVLRLWTETGVAEIDRGVAPYDARLAALRLPAPGGLDPAGLLPLVYRSSEGAPDGFLISALDPATGAEREVGVVPYLPAGITRVWHILPSPDGGRVVVAASPSGSPLTLLYLIEGGRARAIGDGSTDNWPEAWSPDGSRLIILSTRNSSVGCAQYTCFYDIYSVDVATGAETQLTATEDAEARVEWSPQGDRIAFTRGCSDQGNEACGPSLYVMGAGGGPETLLAEGWVGEFSFSPDGGQIAYTQRVDGFSDLYVVPAGGGEPRQVAGEAEIDEVAPRWSPDGGQIAFSRIEGVCQVERCDEAIYLAPAAGGAPRLVRDLGERGGLLFSGWAADGRLLLALRDAGDRARLLAYAADGAPLGEALVTIPMRDTE